MRPIDRLEVSVEWGDRVLEGVRKAILRSTLCWAVENERGELLTVFGVAPLPQDGVGSPWLLATTHFKGYSKELLRNSRRYINLMNRAYPFLYNRAHPDNKATLRWLQWCGFELEPQMVPVGISQTLFQPFTRKF
ncbi:hypothetical protein A7981_05690 [Methylovorus sp. MM2]|nr:hypothetical protein A7981_05690 [Methylovorus sp. MM2]